MSIGSFFVDKKQEPCFSDVLEDLNDKKCSTIHRLPLFSRCPITNEAKLEDPQDYFESRVQRIPLNSISNVSQGSNMQKLATMNSNFNSSACNNFDGANRNKGARATIYKPSLDEIKDYSMVALTNKFGRGKYWFKSASPTPDPRWSADQQLMIGPIPGDVEYSQLRAAFLAQGHTLHLFIQNNQGWLEKNQEKFGSKHVKFGYVVYTDKETARRLLCAGFVAVGPVKIRVKEMDGEPAFFT